MFATLTVAGLTCSAMYAAMKWNDDDKKKIQHVFRNIGYRIKDKEPRLIKTSKCEKYTDFVYSVPYGLVDDEKLQPVLEKTLRWPVKVMFEGKLIIRVYKDSLPTEVKYDWLPSEDWTVPIGQTQDGMLYHDFDKIPHMTIAGMTRNGKTVLIKLLIAHLIHSHGKDVEIYIVDMKGKLEFNRYKQFKQVKRVAGDVFEAHKMLVELQSKMKGDMKDFLDKDYTNIVDTPIKRRRFVITDEAGQLVPESHMDKDLKNIYKECQYIQSEVCRIGGALGYRHIHCTQYPTNDNLPRQIKQNSDAKITFRLPTEIASRVAIDENGAEKLKHKGRGIFRSGDRYEFQAPLITTEEIFEKLKGEIEHATSGEKTAERRKDTIMLGGVELCDAFTVTDDHAAWR